VTIAVLIVLALTYGFGTLFFLWWDGGIWRKLLIMICLVALSYAAFVTFEAHKADF
jgi:hypothetical protein